MDGDSAAGIRRELRVGSRLLAPSEFGTGPLPASSILMRRVALHPCIRKARCSRRNVGQTRTRLLAGPGSSAGFFYCGRGATMTQLLGAPAVAANGDGRL